MSLTDNDKRVLIEVINHIHHAYVSDQAFKESESTSITLPARLVRLSAELVGQTYRPGILNSLDKPDVELLLTSLFNSVDAMKASLQTVMLALPQELPAWVRDQFHEQLKSMEALSREPQTAPSPYPLIEAGKAVQAVRLEPDDLRQRHQELADTQEALSQVDLDKLREEVSQLEAAVRPRQREMEELQRSVSDKTAELETLTSAISEAKKILKTHDVKAKKQLENVVSIAGELTAAIDPYLSKCESQIREAVETVAEQVSEGRRLKTELLARINEVSEVFGETERISAVLGLYTDANWRVVRSVPTTINVTKEKLIRIEEQLREIDAELKDALMQHQSARHVAEVARV
jgi:methyl-accepting chemotaxis protein